MLNGALDSRLIGAKRREGEKSEKNSSEAEIGGQLLPFLLFYQPASRTRW